MFTTDLALKFDPAYGAISKRFHENPKEFEVAWGKAWYKLTHRDMGPLARCLGPYVAPAQLWQDPVPDVAHKLVGDAEIAELKASLLASGICSADLVRTAWSSASTHRVTDFRGGANGARIRLAPQKDWAVNDPSQLAKTLQKLEEVQAAFNDKHESKISLADLIVLGGCAAIEEAAKKGGQEITVPFTPGRTDATAEQTDAAAFAVLEPTMDGFRNHLPCPVNQAFSLVDRAHMLSLTAAQMAVLVAGLRVLNANVFGTDLGVLTSSPGTLNNDFFVNLLDMGTEWAPSVESKQVAASCAT
jgi:catalase-peroxidase